MPRGIPASFHIASNYHRAMPGRTKTLSTPNFLLWQNIWWARYRRKAFAKLVLGL